VIDTSVNEVLTDIKSVPLTGVKIKKQNGKYEATIIFDV
jgi:hypothetical protein